MVGQSDGERHNHEGGIGMARGGEDGAAGDVQSVYAVHLAIRVHHPVFRANGHAGGADRVAAIHELSAFPVAVAHPVRNANDGQAQAGKLRADGVGQGCLCPRFRLVHPPVHSADRQPEAILDPAKLNAAVGVGNLLGAHQETDAADFAPDPLPNASGTHRFQQQGGVGDDGAGVTQHMIARPLGQPCYRCERVTGRILVVGPRGGVQQPFRLLPLWAQAVAEDEVVTPTFVVQHVGAEQVPKAFRITCIHPRDQLEVAWMIHQEAANRVVLVADAARVDAI